MALVAWYPLISNMNNQGVGDTDLTVTSTPTFVSGLIGGALQGGGAAKWTATQTANVLNNTAMSFAFWVYPDAETGSTSARARFFGNDSPRHYSIFQYPTCNDLHWDWRNNAGSTVLGGVLSGVLPSYKWTHVAFTYQNPTFKIYINGVLKHTASASLDVQSYANATSVILPCSGRKLCDYRVYTHCLSALEVKQISQALILHYPMTGGGRGGENIITDTSPNEVQYTYPASGSSDRFFKTSTIVPSASQYILSFWAKSTHAGDKVRAHWYSPNTTTKSETNQGETTVATDGRIDFTLSDKWEKYWCIWTQSSTTAVKHFIFPRMYNQAAGQACGTGTVSIKCVKLEEGNIPTPWIPNSADTAYTSMGYNSTTEYDVSGYNYHGTKNGSMTYSSDTPRYNVNTVFNGSNTAISKSGFSIGNQWSYGMWYKSADLSSGWQSVLLLNTSGSDTDTQLGFYTNHSQSRLQSTANGAYNSQIALPHDTNWHHYFCTYDGSSMKTYLDGVLVNTTTITNALLSKSNLVVGARSANSTATSFGAYFNGKISDVRIYATVLSATQIKELYNTAVSISNNGTLMGYELIEN